MNNRHLVIGLGEVGKPLQELLGADGYDLWLSTSGPPCQTYEVIHIAFPYSVDFANDVKDHQHVYGAQLTVIHSTVPIGTTKQIPNAVHSPVFGKHMSMHYDMTRYPKLIGGDPQLAKRLLDDFRKARLDPFPGFTSDQTEAIKLLDLAVYGSQIATQRMVGEVLKSVDMKPDWWTNWTETLNDELDPLLRRPVITGEGPIGGHCVVPGARLLDAQFPHEILKGILRYGG